MIYIKSTENGTFLNTLFFNLNFSSIFFPIIIIFFRNLSRELDRKVLPIFVRLI